MGAPLLQLPDATLHPAETALGLGLPFAFQIAGRTQRQVHALVEVVAGFPVPAPDLVGHMGAQELASLVQESLVLVGQRDT